MIKFVYIQPLSFMYRISYSTSFLSTNLFCYLLLIFPMYLSGQIKSPQEFLGYELGTQFTRHYQVVNYFNHLSESHPQVKLETYGKTYEDRPLIVAFVSSEKNLNQLEKIRKDNLIRAKLNEGTPKTDVGIVWLSYNVHGNESSSTEASMKTIYTLLSDDSKQQWLENTLVIIDPCLNPDGRERYVNFYWQYANQKYNPDPYAMEHIEPWPGGRANHYLFDLNRDWSWLTQIETQQRVYVYNQWLPQIHVDFHEQGINSPYYFAPAAQPYHEQITSFQRDFQKEIGKNHAKYFDENHWFYFTKQHFDLLYPSYGDTYPIYSGSIGMTYEQAGHGRAGLGVLKQENDTLTLQNRIEHHTTTGLSTIEIASKNISDLLHHFQKFYEKNNDLKYQTFVLKYDGNKDKFQNIKTWLDAHQIQYGSAKNVKGLKGYDYANKKISPFFIDNKDLVISMNQPKAILAHILLEPQTKLIDSLTYDITAWGVPYVYGIQAYATNSPVIVEPIQKDIFKKQIVPKKTYAFVCEWKNIEDAHFLSTLLKNGIKARFTKKAIYYQGKKYDRGTLIIAKRDNLSLGNNFEKIVIDYANREKRTLDALTTGFMDQVPDLGSSDIRYIKRPNIALIGGSGTSSLSYGATWHFFEQELDYPVTTLGISYLHMVNLSKYDVIIMPSGDYEDLAEEDLNNIIEWINTGGKLVVIEDAIELFIDKEYSQLKKYATESEKEKANKKQEKEKAQQRLVKYANRERHALKNYIPGAIFKVRLDNTHPLAFGYTETYYTLKTASNKVSYMNSGNVGVIERSEDIVSGFAGYHVKENIAETLVFGVENKENGKIIFLVDNPLFRSFWKNGKLLFANSLFFVGQ